MKSIPSNKTTENYGLSKGFYEMFRSTLKDLLLKSFNQTKTSLTMLNKTTLQWQAIKKLEKRTRIKGFSLVDTDLNFFSKALAAKLKYVLPSLTASQQAANVQNKYTDEGGRLISDVLDISDKLKIEG